MSRNKKTRFVGEPTPSASPATEVAPGRGGGTCPTGGTEAPDDGFDICLKPLEGIADWKADLRAKRCSLGRQDVTVAGATRGFSVDGGSKVYMI